MSGGARVNSIYVLKDPQTDAVRYVGVTACNPAVRLRSHINQARSGKQTHCARWIRTLLEQGLRPVMQVIEETEDRTRENNWIAHYWSLGCQLTNLSEGGEGVVNRIFTPEHRARLSAAMKGRRPAPQTMQASVEARRRTGLSDDQRQRISKALKGRPWSDARRSADRVSENHARVRFLTYQGETLALTAWAQKSGLKLSTLHARLERGWPTERALTERDGRATRHHRPPNGGVCGKPDTWTNRDAVSKEGVYS